VKKTNEKILLLKNTDKQKNKASLLFKKINFKNIAFRLAGVLFASVSIYGFAPFGIAHLAQNRKFSTQAVVSLALGLVGTFLLADMYVALKYAMAMAIYTTMIYSVTSRDEEANTITAGVIAAGSVFISSIALLIWGENLQLATFALILLESLVVFACVWIFSSKSNEDNEKLPYFPKLRIAVMLCALVLSVAPLRIGYIFSAENFLAVTLILILASTPALINSLSSKFAATLGAGIILGFILGLGGAETLPNVAVFGICALVSVAAATMARIPSEPFGGYTAKFAAVAGFAAAYFLLSVYISGGVWVLTIYEILAAGVLILLLPKRMFAYAASLIPNFGEFEIGNEITIGDTDNAGAIINKRLSEVSAMFQNLSTLIGKVFEKHDPSKMKNEEDISQMFDTAAERVCKKCKKVMLCWQKDYNSTYDACFKMLESLESQGEVDAATVPLHFREKCIKLPELVNEINSLYGIYRVNCIWKNKMAQNRELLGEQYGGISRMLIHLARDIHRNPQRQDNVVEKLAFSVSSAARGCNPFEENGDCHCFVNLSGGKYAVILSDGMGHGNRAALESSMIVEILRNVLENGFDKTIAVKMINSIMGLKPKDSYSTVDICILDAVAGNAEFIKLGAAPAYVKRKNKVETVRAGTLPVGVLSTLDFEVETLGKTLNSGDYIVMISDGTESGANSWVKNFLLESNPQTPPDELADMLLANACENNKHSDDMICVAIRVAAVSEVAQDGKVEKVG